MTTRSRATSPTLMVVDWSGMSIMLIWLSCWLYPSNRTSVFVGFSFSLLDGIQSLMASTHAVNLWTAGDSSPTVVLIYIIEKTSVYHTVNGDPALFHTSKTAKMMKVILLRAPCQNVNVLHINNTGYSSLIFCLKMHRFAMRLWKVPLLIQIVMYDFL